MIELCEALYGSASIELAHDLKKYAQMLFNSRDYFNCFNVTLRASKILEANYSDEHSEMADLEEIMVHLHELSMNYEAKHGSSGPKGL